MKLQAKIIESAIPKNGVEKQSIFIEFIDDNDKQHFEISIEDFDAYYLGIIHQMEK